MKKEEKTNVMRVLDGKKIAYESHSYEQDATLTGVDIAGILGEDPKHVFKTLVTQGKSNGYYVFVVPVEAGLDLKKAAKASGEKAIAMIKQKDLLALTGYVHGGCSPIGMKKQFPTFIHESALELDKIFVSAGKVGYQIELAPADLIKVANIKPADIAAFDQPED
ncbi:MAG: Cys-tRNA(Pro) deacylase [Lachnospiraceae bacterium]|nr:Cys-tRNA(Pro) deacylase [Lachnospiraceae bacterium]